MKMKDIFLYVVCGIFSYLGLYFEHIDFILKLEIFPLNHTKIFVIDVRQFNISIQKKNQQNYYHLLRTYKYIVYITEK